MIRTRDARSRGVVLVESVLLVFGILAIAALTIDLGLAFVVQSQMQCAADAAALEGVRWSDEVDDATRRARAAALIGVAFDDDLSPDPSDPDPYGLGAGPILGLTGGAAPSYGGQQFDLSGPTVYKPNAEGVPIEPNLENLNHGDLVAGLLDDDPLLSHEEASDYSREDFAPDPAGTAFLVRMRRSHDPLLLDRQPGVSSSGPALPLLFGLGALVGAAEGAAYDPRRDGFTVRATSVADRRRALRIAVPAAVSPEIRARLGVLPLVPIVIRAAAWESLAVGTEVLLDEAGFAFGEELLPDEDPGDRLDFVGEAVEERAASVVGIGGGDAIVPVVADLEADGATRVIGFGVATIPAVAAGEALVELPITRRAGRLLRSGADAKDAAALRALAGSEDLWAAHASMSGPVLAPVLFR
ncbi:MAG: pilus assembly protein TadG-related protein [Planctomycetota bacterium JB042]